MFIINQQVIKGPNYWSNYRKKLIVFTIDIDTYEERPSNLIKNFNENLIKLLPSLNAHRCSPGVFGGFLMRLNEGTWLGHIIEHVALELQTLAGMDCGFGRTYGTSKTGVYQVIFSYEHEEAGLYAGKAAFNLVKQLASGQHYNELEEDISSLQYIARQASLGPSTASIVNEAKIRNIPFKTFPNSSLVIFGQGCYQKSIWATVTSETSAIGMDTVSDKELTKKILENHFIPVPHGTTVCSLAELENALENLSFPLVIKPYNGNHGRGVLTNIHSRAKALLGYELAKKISKTILIEEYIRGNDYRFLVINYKVVAVAKRTPACIEGDGVQTIKELIGKINSDPRRGKGHGKVLTTIEIDEETNTLLIEKGLSLDSVLPESKILHLKSTANLSAGGTATDVTDLVHFSNIHLAQRIARIVNLDICGIDIVSEGINQPIQKYGGAVIEVNAGPGLRMHLQPSQGKSRNVAAPILDMLYPPESKFTIPIVAVTGTNGKTTVVRLTAFLAQTAKFSVGFTTTEGIYINEKLIFSGDCSGPKSANAVLGEPNINFAVLECARGGILRSGLAFDECDISVITNVSSDHLGLKEINTLEELVQVKAVVARSTKKTGYCILNAEDDLVYALKTELSCTVALFALNKTDRIQKHCELNGGLACYIEKDFIVVQKGITKNTIAPLSRIPLAFQGTSSAMSKNILPAVLVAFISKFSLTDIQTGLYNFHPTPENLPGRMNLFTFDSIELMLDYAHNEGGYLELKTYLNTKQSKHRVGIISVSGDRRPIDMQNVGSCAAELFDEIIITHPEDTRGNTNENITNELMTGIRNSGYVPSVEVISNEYTAVKTALKRAHSETFIFYTPENVFEAIEFLKGIQKELSYV
ncbi:cyanophycin synthetase [Legionella lytica]|uniref:Cyanophycin synthetase n=1 Tax=Legionella lytica TaxID=96232 RepID=A0ABW8D8X6_9GAMM